ncbi:MAG: hypothetical protein V7L25_06570 [Nostoc sp.]|uniref:hypothetical protein n=1 Tax=Nostoc sp. TaxID=1180 RepID=UPI002FF409E5
MRSSPICERLRQRGTSRREEDSTPLASLGETPDALYKTLLLASFPKGVRGLALSERKSVSKSCYAVGVREQRVAASLSFAVFVSEREEKALRYAIALQPYGHPTAGVSPSPFGRG